MIPKRLPNGNIRAPLRAYDEASGAVGDGFVELAPGDKDYDSYDKYMATDAYKALVKAEGGGPQGGKGDDPVPAK